jgi:flagellar M-ring protein FliF
MEPLVQSVRGLWTRWSAMSLPRKVVLALGTVTAVTFGSLIYWAAQPEYRVLYANLSADEAGAITSKLQTKGTPYRLAAGGTTILVPYDVAMQTFIDLNMDGTPGNAKLGKGYDLFDQPMLGSTPFNQHVNFLRAQQAELARTIMQITPIANTRVHIVKPEPSPFIRDQKPTTASVMVTLRQGAKLNRQTVAGITSFVAGSVEGLTRENVRIIDSSGQLLSEQHDPETGLFGSSIDQRRDIEQHLAHNAESVLMAALGPGKAVIRVTAEINNKLLREKTEKIDIEGKATIMESSEITKQSGSGNGNRGGPAGSASNLGKGAANSSSSTSSSTRENQKGEFQYPRTIQEVETKPGAITRLTVAAIVDPTPVKGDQPLELPKIEETIKKAVGFKEGRDEIHVTTVKMPGVTPPEIPEEDPIVNQRWTTVLGIVRYVSIAMVALCAFPIVVALFRRRAAPPSASDAATSATTAAAPAPADKLRRLTDVLERDPDGLAKVLTQWIEKSEGSQTKAA